MGVEAFSFQFTIQLPGGRWRFDTNLGSNVTGVIATGGEQDRNFLGWIGNSSKLLNSVVFSAPEGVLLDNIHAYNTVPEPATIMLFGLGLLGIARFNRKK